ncbi:hypothetical protein LSH36_1382g00008 [Paralvinella palmiformis]|uniref:Uncharacterized protein n=1 Tax=Paralvinella palmiformis TaxID=53620 RepID=A0AAD9IUK2_9ANNE|nr:hypothetical protein LSH36_1382g00008 [Paralvinella palmiformis]
MSQSSLHVVSYVKSHGSHQSSSMHRRGCYRGGGHGRRGWQTDVHHESSASSKRATNVVVHTHMMENVTLVVSMDTIRSNAEINVTAHLVADGQTKVNQ